MNKHKTILFSTLSTFTLYSAACTIRSKRSDMSTVAATAKPIALQIYRFTNVASQDYETMVNSHHASLKTFVDLLASECEIRDAFSISPTKTVTAGPGETIFKDAEARGSRNGLPSKARDFPFQFFQLDLFRLFDRHKDALDRGSSPEISVLMMEGLEGNCGFALPQVQFKEVPSHSSFKEITNSLKNRVLIDTSRDNHRDCANRSRILSHELAHVLVQDDPAHMCMGSGGSKITCPKDNLMASLVWVPIPKKPRPGAEPPAMGEPENFGMRQIQANGTNLTPDQCEAIKRTIGDLVSGN